MKNIWTNGCYDILHIGHIELLKYAKSIGDRLIVGIDTDRRVRELKGDDRPFNNQNIRKIFLESIRYVDEVVLFDNDNDLENWLKYYSIDTIVIGDEYKDKKILGSKYAKLDFFKKIPNISTSKILSYNL